MMVDETSSEFRLKIACLLNLVTLECETEFSFGTATEFLDSRKKDNTPLLYWVHSDDLKYVDIFRRFFNVFFQGFVA
jgi:hypothetical protein